MSDLPATAHAQATDVAVAVIGAGISGIGAAIGLRAAGVTDLVVLEQADDLGGTWRDNTYPGCACDVPSALYSYSFAPNPDWSRAFAGQAEILAYVRGVAERSGVVDAVRYGTRVEHSDWDAVTQRWRLTTSSGTVRARVLVAASGPWHAPRIPDLPGLETFPGASFHSSRWDHEVDLDGARVAVVGTGASAVQFVPEIRQRTGELHVFQRTAQWVLPKPDAAVPRAARRAMRRVPGAGTALRGVQYALLEGLGVGFRHPVVLRSVQQLGRLHLRATVPDPRRRRALTPDHTLGCKRLLLSNTWYPALAHDDVTVHPTALDRVEGSAVIGADGSRAEVDVIVFGTGFHITDMPIAEHLHDARGRSLADHWQGSPQAHLGTTVAGFPNLFLLLGPNLGTGHSSAFAILEAQVEHVVSAVDFLRDRGWGAIEPRADVQERFNARVQDALATTVYNAGGCTSYYLDANGRNSFSWPWSTARLQREVARFDPTAHVVHTPVRTAVRAA